MLRQANDINNNEFEEFDVEDNDSAPLISSSVKLQSSYCESFYNFLGKLKNNIYTAADIQPELNYTIGVAASYFSKPFMDYLPSAWPQPVLPEIPSTVITVGWNYLDAICGLVSAVKLISDKESFHQGIDKTKAVLNILSSAQSLLFTYQNFFPALGVTGLAGASFTVSVLSDCINQSLDVKLAGARADVLGWLEDSLEELKQIEERLQNTPTNNNEYDNLQINKIKLINNIRSRCRVHYFANEKVDLDCDYTEDGSTLKVDIQNVTSPMQFRRKQISEVFLKSGITDDLINFDLCFSPPNARDYAITTAIQVECDEILRTMSISLVYKIVSLTGMALMSASVLYPSMFAPGLLLTSSVGAYYLGKNIYKLKQYLQTSETSSVKVSSNANSFFKAEDVNPLEDDYDDTSLLVLASNTS